jgi:D-alanyl-D-alanine carboxypeptidase
MAMKYSLMLIIMVLFSGCEKEKWDDETMTCSMGDSMNHSHPKAAGLQQVLDKYVAKGLPGVAVSIYSADGYWHGAAGFAKIENKTRMMSCHLQYSQSIAKTYMAVGILKLYESGAVNLDQAITAYLPEEVTSKVSGASKMTVRMLLNHTSGVAEYNDKAAYVTYLLQHPLHKFSSLDYLEYIQGSDVQFVAGSKYKYTNTNYLLLALIADKITGDHAKYLRDHIFVPVGLANSFYHNDENYLRKGELVNSYWDRYSNSQIENCTEMQKTNVGSLVGDDGIIATPVDYVKFLQALMNHQLLSRSTMDQMFTFINNDSDEGAYGLGIHKKEYRGFTEYGHSGGGIGAGSYLAYFPHNQTYLFIAINLGTSVNSPLFDDLDTIVDEVFDALI